ncbi:MAG: radical SAM protein [Cyanobacteriota/Melainabacteria group bacterium]
MDFDRSPFLVLWELTRACGLKCRHCRAVAVKERDREELEVSEAARFLDDLSGMGRPLIVLTGGDPVQRPDLLDIVDLCRERGFATAMTPSGTPSVTEHVIEQLKSRGLTRLAISLDAPDRMTRDYFRGSRRLFRLEHEHYLLGAKAPPALSKSNTAISTLNVQICLMRMATLVEHLGAVLWSVFFLVPVGRASEDMQITPIQAERVMIGMAELASSGKFDVKSTAAPQFRRVLLQRRAKDSSVAFRAGAGGLNQLDHKLKLGRLRSYGSVNDGRGLIFVSHRGEIMPSGFLPLVAGNVREDSVTDIYRNHPLFKTLRDPDLLQGKCGICRYKRLCGGSRARAYGRYGDYMAEDPLCVFKDRIPAQ